MHYINLLNSIRFDYRLILNAEVLRQTAHFVNYLLHEIFKGTAYIKTEEKTTAIINFIGNLVFALMWGKVVAISQNRNDYALQKFYGIRHHSYRSTKEIINYSDAEKYIEVKTGYRDFENNEGYITRIWATPKLTDELNIRELTDKTFVQKIGEKEFLLRRNNFKYIKHTTPILLKDKDKNLIKYKPNKKIIRMKNFLEEYNELMEGVSIIIPDRIEVKNSVTNVESKIASFSSDYKHLHINKEEYNTEVQDISLPLLRTNEANTMIYNSLAVNLYRVFSRGDFKYGGRFFGGEYQQMNKQERKEILIYGNKTVEADYSGLHLNMLYHLSGLEFSDDPYLAVSDDLELRKVLKLISLIAINAIKRDKAIKAINHARYENWEMHQLLNSKNIKSDELLAWFEKAHHKIAKHFYSDEGVRLQNIDSQIAEQVLKHFTKQGIACLCIHDSFIVEEKYKDELEIVMQETYQKMMGHKTGITFVS